MNPDRRKVVNNKGNVSDEINRIDLSRVRARISNVSKGRSRIREEKKIGKRQIVSVVREGSFVGVKGSSG